MPADTVATADSGAHRILASQIWRCSMPRQMLQSSALCTMGCAVPLAMGHRLVDGQSPVIAFVGDAGLEMCLGELSTLRDLNIPVIICVLVDTSLALIELKQRGSQRPNVGVDFGETDFSRRRQSLWRPWRVDRGCGQVDRGGGGRAETRRLHPACLPDTPARL
ncbi:thiamine pyrophosphate-dependent enzyme [Roseibium salinum]|nr:thiamine pyrophosphate-dependent enzyme [Roseibium salinum]